MKAAPTGRLRVTDRHRPESCPENRSLRSRQPLPHSTHASSNTGDCCNGRMDFVHEEIDFFLNFLNFFIQLTNEPNGVLQFQRLGRHGRANGISGSITNPHGFLPSVAALGCFVQKICQACKMGGCNLFRSRKFAEKCVSRCHMKGWNQLFQFRKEDADKTGDRAFQLCPFLNLVKSVSC